MENNKICSLLYVVKQRTSYLSNIFSLIYQDIFPIIYYIWFKTRYDSWDNLVYKSSFFSFSSLHSARRSIWEYSDNWNFRIYLDWNRILNMIVWKIMTSLNILNVKWNLKIEIVDMEMVPTRTWRSEERGPTLSEYSDNSDCSEYSDNVMRMIIILNKSSYNLYIIWIENDSHSHWKLSD